MTAVGRIAEIWRYPVKSMAGESIARATLGAMGIPGDRGWALRDEAAGEIRGAKKLPLLMRCRATYDSEPTADTIPPVTMTLPDGATLHSSAADVHARLSALLERAVTLWPRQPAERRDHYRRGIPDHADLDAELRQVFGRLPDEPLPDLSAIPSELFEFTSPLGTYFDLAPIHLLSSASLRTLGARNGSALFDRRRFRPNFLIESSAAMGTFPEAEWTGRRLRVGDAMLALTIQTVRCSMTTHAVDELPKDPSVLRTIVRAADQNLGVYATVEQPGAVAVGDAVDLL